MANPLDNLRPWPKGVSGNPAGYSRKRRQVDDLLDLIDEKGAERAISAAWLKAILAGEFAFLREYLDRRDGPVPKETHPPATKVIVEHRDDDPAEEAASGPAPGESGAGAV